MRVDPLRIERAIAIMDPIGLLSLGAPVREYAREAEKISAGLSNLSFKSFKTVYTRVMEDCFFMLKGQDQIIAAIEALVQEDVSPRRRFKADTAYIARTQFRFGSFVVSKGVVVVCLSRVRGTISFYVEGKVQCVKSRHEIRTRWLMEEV